MKYRSSRTIRAFGDIELNETLQKYIIETLRNPTPNGIITTIFIGDIVVPNYGKIKNISFFETLLPLLQFDGKTRIKNEFDHRNPKNSFKDLLKTIAPSPNANLTSYKLWTDKNFNFRSKWLDNTELIGYDKDETTPSMVFILGNKEVQLIFDIYNNLCRNKLNLPINLLEEIYNYVNHCMDYVIQKDNVYIHNFYNYSRIPGSYYYITGHCGGIHKRRNMISIDSSKSYKSEYFVFYF